MFSASPAAIISYLTLVQAVLPAPIDPLLATSLVDFADPYGLMGDPFGFEDYLQPQNSPVPNGSPRFQSPPAPQGQGSQLASEQQNLMPIRQLPNPSMQPGPQPQTQPWQGWPSTPTGASHSQQVRLMAPQRQAQAPFQIQPPSQRPATVPAKVTNPASATSGAPSSSPDAALTQDCLTRHNNIRTSLGLSTFNTTQALITYAHSRAQKLASTDIYAHEQGPYGENLFMGAGDPSSCERAMLYWYDKERPLYHGETLSMENFSKIGHLVSVVWPTTTSIGCASATSGSGRLYIVCNYSPRFDKFGVPLSKY